MDQAMPALDYSFYFHDRPVLVTGGASGIGLAIAERLLASGARVAVWDLRQDRLDALAQRYGDRVLSQLVNVADAEAVTGAMAELFARWGGVAHLVNNAGIIGRIMTLDAFDPTEFQRVLSVNLASVAQVTAAFVGADGDFGERSIVNLASIAARTGGMVGNMAYATTKAGVATMTLSMSKELAPHVRVNALAPGIIDTEIQMDSLGDREKVDALADIIPLKRLGQPAEVAEAAVWLLSPGASYTTGSLLDVAGGR
ncbi:MAG: SDR family oxidoreductase [Oceanospirillaceae bacterium]|uniref:SDR family NAD(P)-dependent oxidoreductase n=1 Tax=Salipiger sp. HF18 TaxID=2721557 RepID=UPI00142E5DA7|nr:SDR family NAD(P)-dependent oxidoreductase [Salipiger sp. HF18]NIY97323.1 SDR family oxidoreductase [Salipiger sp. HF18]NVK39920.1 SDR family oxidoreductase [Oceanospirillaceae bacterium]